MYTIFYSLSKEPFPKDIRPQDAYQTTSHKGALEALEYLKKSKGMGIILGQPGLGKSYTLRTFTESLNPNLYHLMYFPLSTVSVMDFYRSLVYMLGETPKHRKIDLFRQIQKGIEKMYHERKITPIFILDEIHLTPDAFLQDLALLFNFEMDSVNPFILIMAGLPHFKTKLRLNSNESLRQRIIMKYEMEPLCPEEVKSYIEHQMGVAGANMPIFTETALQAITTNSQGIPRTINNLAVQSLLFGSKFQKNQIDESIVRLAFEDSL
jgi:general secretion pathway protein A